MTFLSRGKRSRRQRRIHLALWSTLVGTAAVTGLVLWLESGRDTDLTDPTLGVTAEHRNAGDVTAAEIRFRDVAGELGVRMRHGPGPRGRTLPEDTGSGLAWGDVDGDGDWDLYVVNFPGPLRGTPDPAGGNRLYLNDGNRFTDASEAAGVEDTDGFGMGASFADYDADGDVDLYVTNFGANRLYLNHGDGTFEEVGDAAGVADPSWSSGVAWGDFDRDGHLDLYVLNYVDYDIRGIDFATLGNSRFGTFTVPFTLNPNSFDPAPNRLYRNRGDGTFEDVAESANVSDPEGRSLAATFCDLDGDGWLDLYVNNDVSPNRLFRNLCGKFVDAPKSASGSRLVFADLSTITGTADPRGSMGLSVREIGNVCGEPDGLPDLFITHWVAQENALYQSTRNAGGVVEYRDRTRQVRLGEMSTDTVGWGCVLADLDGDGRPDLAVANGSTLERKDDPRELKAERAFLFWNAGRRFQNVAKAAGDALARPHSARGLAAADFDGDGDVDLALSINRGQPLLLRNETRTANRTLRVRLRGRPAACFGSRLEVTVGRERQVAWYGADVSFLSMHAPELVFGLGEAAAAEKVHVTWADGRVGVLENVPSGQVEVRHPAAAR